MKTSKAFFFSTLFVLFSGLSAFASGIDNTPKKAKLSSQISSLISAIDFSSMKSDSESMTIQFMINNDDEIVVLDMTETVFESQIASKLNYQKVDAVGIQKNKLFLIPVVVERR